MFIRLFDAMIARQWRLGLLGVTLCLGLNVVPVHAGNASKITVFAAASLKNALDEIALAYGKASGITVTGTYAASSALAKQIEHGAPADVFVSADPEWMDYLAGKKLIAEGSRRNLAGNKLVLIAPAASALEIDIAPGFALAEALGGGRLAVGEIRSVPAGRYAKSALQSLGVWASVENKLAQSENVRVALSFVALGETPLGIVYRTDALVEPKVKIVAAFPGNSHPPIVYPAAVTAEAKAPGPAGAFVDWLASPQAAAIFERQGFSVVK